MRFSPSPLRGAVRAPDSKSVAHRRLICAALSQSPSLLRIRDLSEDILATIRCLCALGSTISHEGDTLSIRPVWRNLPCRAALDCGESGTTLRLLLPVAAALGVSARFSGSGRLPNRPNTPLLAQMSGHGVEISGDSLPHSINGALKGGTYELPGDISSQYISGLLLALPHLSESSRIAVTSPLASAGYVALTLSAMHEYGYVISGENGKYCIEGGQRGAGGCFDTEGDWSNAAFWLAANALGQTVAVTGLNDASVQGDREIVALLKRIADEPRGIEIDAADIPDLVPILAFVATQAHGTTRIRNAGRLRIKECDRLAAMRENLCALGADVMETQDGLVINGPARLRGGTVSAWNDHRIAMSMAIAATIANGDVLLSGAESVAKSYPRFYDDYRALGGIAVSQDDPGGNT